MYGGKRIYEGDTAFVFASENEGGQGLLARGIVTSSKAIAKKVGIERQTPRVSVTVTRTANAKRPLGRNELKRNTNCNDGQPQTELNFKLYRQATNKIIGISQEAAVFLDDFFYRHSNSANGTSAAATRSGRLSGGRQVRDEKKRCEDVPIAAERTQPVLPCGTSRNSWPRCSS